jgi:hypothetical protein
VALFSLRSQRTGQYKAFSLLEVLQLLGDKTNDEIWLEDGEDVYNLSSFIELNSSNSGGQNPILQWRQEAPENCNGLSLFTLTATPHNALVLVFLNGICQKHHQDYSLQNKSLQFSFLMNAQDSLQFYYQTNTPLL